MKKCSLAVVVGLAIANLAGCATLKSPLIDSNDLPESYKGSVSASKDLTSHAQWWKSLDDPQLNALIQKALKNNTDIKVASAQILAAQAVLKGSNASFFPVFDLAVDGSKGRQVTQSSSFSTSVASSASGQLGASYELDVWGRLKDISESNEQALRASQYDKQAVELTVISSVVKGYLTLQEKDALILQYEKLLDNQKQTINSVEVSFDKGFISTIDVHTAKNALRDAQNALVAQRADRDLAENALALLVGDQALSITPHPLDLKLDLPVVKEGLPSSLLASRPDVQKARATLAGADADIEVAKKAFFPQINLTASLGTQSGALSSLMKNGSHIWSAGYGLDLPLFDGGLRVANLWQSRAERESAVASYKFAVQSAFKDVNNSIIGLNSTKVMLDNALMTNKASEKVYNLMSKQYLGGLISYTALLANDNEYRQTQLSLISERFDYLGAWVDFNTALGN